MRIKVFKRKKWNQMREKKKDENTNILQIKMQIEIICTISGKKSVVSNREIYSLMSVIITAAIIDMK